MLHLADLGWQHQGAEQGHKQPRRHGGHGARKTQGRQQHATEKEAHPLEGIFGAGEDGHPLEQLVLALALVVWAVGHHRFDGAFGTHLVEVLGDATEGLGGHHVEHRGELGPAFGNRHQHQQGHDLQHQPRPEGEPQAKAGAQPAAGQVGDNAEKLVEHKQQGDLQAGVAELVEVEHHQHAQGAIGEGEGPIGGRHHHVLLQRRELARHGAWCTTWLTRSAMREL